jgi:hypothetical protein
MDEASVCSGVVGLSNVKLRRVRLAAKGSVLQCVLLKNSVMAWRVKLRDLLLVNGAGPSE